MNDIKVITICGSMKFKDKMIEIANDLELNKKHAVIQCVYGENKNNYNKNELDLLSKIHFKKIDISDAIYVVNVDGYIGESTKKEIEYARKNNKEILSLNPLNLD